MLRDERKERDVPAKIFPFYGFIQLRRTRDSGLKYIRARDKWGTEVSPLFIFPGLPAGHLHVDNLQ